MNLKLEYADLARLEKIREALEANDPQRHFAPLGMHQLTIATDAIDALTAAVARELERAGRTAGRASRVCVLADAVPIMRAGHNLKELVFDRLSQHFDVERLTLTDSHPKLHADEASLAQATEGTTQADCIVSVGGGTITDIAKIAAMRNKTPVHVVVQTAASVDGFTDNFSVVLQKGVKRTLLSRWPDVVLTDCQTIAEAPHELNASGFGELVSMYCAPGDWFLAAKFGMDGTFAPALIELLALCGEGVEEWSAGVGRGEIEGCRRLATALAVRGIVSGVGGTTASLSGMEHVISHMLDMHNGEQGEPIGLHGAQVGVASVIAAAAWEVFCERMEETPLDTNRLFDGGVDWQVRVKGAFAGLDPSGRIGSECWLHYQQKLTHWSENRKTVLAAFANWQTIRKERNDFTLSSREIAACLYRAKAPLRSGDLNPAVSADLWRWAVANCQFMRERVTVADLLNLAGWWDEAGVSRVLDRAEAACQAAEAGSS